MEDNQEIQMDGRDEKEDRVGETVYRYSSSWIYKLETEEHWRLYWRQQKLMEGLVKPGQRVLEIGHGTGFTANYLRTKGVQVTTIDIDPEKKPDIIANIVTYDFIDQYDHILGFEVFEHIPFIEFQKLLNKLSAVCCGYLFLSVPHNERKWFHITVELPKLGRFSYTFKTFRGKITQPHHFWEADHGPATYQVLLNSFMQAGFTIQRKDKFQSLLFFALKAPEKIPTL